MQIIVAERGPLVLVFNFSPYNDYEGYKVGQATMFTFELSSHLPCPTLLAAPSALSEQALIGGSHAQIGTPEPGRYKAVISSDNKQYGGQGRIDNTVEHFTHPEGTPGILSLLHNPLCAESALLNMLASSPSHDVWTLQQNSACV